MTDNRALDITDSLQGALDETISVIPKLILFFIILFIGWLIAKAILKFVDKILDRIGYNRAFERAGLQRWIGQQKASTLTAKLAYYAILLFTLQLAFGVFGPNPVSNLIEAIVRWLPKAFVAIVIIVVAAAIARAVRDLIEAGLGELSYGRLLAKIAQIFIIALGIIAALSQVDVAAAITQPILIATLAAIAGVVIVGVGGGLISPMRDRWERALTRAEVETRAMRATNAGNVGAPMPTEPTDAAAISKSAKARRPKGESS